MGNATIDKSLKERISKLLEKDSKYKIKYQNLKGFLDNACSDLLEKIENEDKK